MGQTPLELAHSLYVRQCAKGNPDTRVKHQAPEARAPEEFTKAARKEGDGDEKGEEAVMRTWDVCKAFAAKHGGCGRKLVSVNEAREVAKRLAERQKRDSAEKMDGVSKEVEEGDEVDQWLGSSALDM
ncbi:MAG: hypothetical protein Q9193_007205, partial [Seirophora villosa]